MATLKELIPPHEGDDRIWRWRLAVAGLLGANIMATAAHIAWACGLLSGIGLTGFAKADDLAQKIELATQQRIAIEKKLDTVQLYTVQSAIKEALKIRCLSILQSNQASLDSANRDLENLQDVYYGITHRSYMAEPCSVVLISKGG